MARRDGPRPIYPGLGRAVRPQDAPGDLDHERRQGLIEGGLGVCCSPGCGQPRSGSHGQSMDRHLTTFAGCQKPAHTLPTLDHSGLWCAKAYCFTTIDK